MIEAFRTGKPNQSIEDYIEFAEDRQFAYLANEAKKEWKRSPAYKATRKWRDPAKHDVDIEVEHAIQYQGEHGEEVARLDAEFEQTFKE